MFVVFDVFALFALFATDIFLIERNDVSLCIPNKSSMEKDKAKYWVVASGSIEYHLKNYAAHPLSKKCISKLIPTDNIILSHYDGFHFRRKDNNLSKAIYILDDETAYDDCCKLIEERYGFMNDIERLGNSFQRYPIEVSNAIYIIENIYRLYTEENINELLPSWYQHFHNALNTLKECGITDGTIRQYIETGNYLNERLSDFKLHQTNDLDIVSGKCWRNYYDYANYQAEDKDELMEYSLVKPKFSGLCVDLYLDDGGAYKRHEHPLWVYFRNGFKKTDNVLPISIDDNPQLLIYNHKINVSENVCKDICNFIKSNKDLLIDFANDQLGHKEFFDRLKPHIWRGYYDYAAYRAEDVDDDELMEYLHLDMNRTGLPIHCFIDDGGSFIGRNHPLWVYICNGYDINDEIIPIGLDAPYLTMLDEYRLNLSTDVMAQVFRFIEKNKELIINLACDEIRNVDFLKRFKPLDK